MGLKIECAVSITLCLVPMVCHTELSCLERFFLMCVFLCMCVNHMPSDVNDLNLSLELETFVNHCVGTGN